MKKKVLVIFCSAILAVSMLTGCGGDNKDAAKTETTQSAKTDDSKAEDSKAEDTSDEAADDSEEASGSEENSGSFSLLDVSSDMIKTGVYGKDDQGTELVFSLFTGPDGKDYASLFEFQNQQQSGDVICGTYEASKEEDENGITWSKLQVHDTYTGKDFLLGFAENDNNEVVFYNAAGAVIEGQYLDKDETINYMGSAAALLENSESQE
ncbi:MAG: hypothetical protein K6G63_08365 [Eubacterium sp.]|nr:hypothetical protein [Eubacterium sp.]